MPELPEVETVRLGLSQLVGNRILHAQDLHPRTLRSDLKLNVLSGAKIKSVNRKGKFLWFTFDYPFYLVAHLGMSGRFLVDPDGAKHNRAEFRLRKGRSEKTLIFDDQRTFGWLKVEPLNTNSEIISAQPATVAHIGIDPFAENFDSKKAIAQYQARKAGIKSLLLNQEIMSGVGNIYADEALWLANIHPNSPANLLSHNELKNLISCAKKVMKKSLQKGGTSFDALYVDVNGESGFFELSLNAYAQDGKPCKKCGSLITAIKFGGRHSHFCPNCQKIKKG